MRDSRVAEEWVVFELGCALFGVPISNVASINEPKKIVAVPRSSSFAIAIDSVCVLGTVRARERPVILLDL